MQSREDSLWESFPQVIQTCEGAVRYINAFRAPFQEVLPLSHQDVYVLQACSLLVIHPPAGKAAPQGGFLTDLVRLGHLGSGCGGQPPGTATQAEQLLGP